MNEACEIVRDLIPLCLDEVATESSKRHVDAHMEECVECAAYYAGMKAALPKRSEAEEKAEKQAFDDMAKTMKKKARRRTLKKVLLGAAIGVVVLALITFGWLKLQWMEEPVYTGFYNIFLSQLKDGRVVFNADYKGSYRYMWIGMQTTDTEDGKVYTINPTWYTLERRDDNPMQNGKFMTIDADEFKEVSAVYMGDGEDQKLVWKRGMEIAPASAEMEEYYVWADLMSQLYKDIYKEGPDGKLMATSYLENAQLDVVRMKEAEASWNVPEWQPMVYDWYSTRFDIDEATLQWVMDSLREKGYLE